jgi:F420-dependent oxidoreductase-like protein
MVAVGIMLEGQFGLNWSRWDRILTAAEDFGYKHVFRSDHFTIGTPEEDSLETWVSLAYAATHTTTLEFGPLVCPTTFRHPAMTVRMAAAVDDLSKGRLNLGLGAGWHEREHTQFGVPFYDVPTRLEMLEEGLEVTTRLLNSDEPVTLDGKHFPLNEAILLPRPSRPGGPPIIIGGNGPKRTLPLVARYAAEWNGVFISLDDYRARNRLLDGLLEESGRQPADVRRSLMTQVIFGRDDTELEAKLDGRDAADLVNRGHLVGTPSALVDQMNAFVEAGAERFMLQWLDLDDIDGLEAMAHALLPHFHTD